MKTKVYASVLIILMVFALLVSCAKTEKPLTAAELIDLGEKYLLEMDYEQALVQFLKVIEVGPMNQRGYTGAADAYVGLGQPSKAIEILIQGLDILQDNTDILMMLGELDTGTQHGIIDDSLTTQNSNEDDEIKSLPLRVETEIEGIIISNSDEYGEQWKRYREQYYKSDETGVVGVGIDSYGVRFFNGIEIQIDGEIVFVNEARLDYNPEIGEIEAFINVPSKMIGSFSTNGLTEELNKPSGDRADYYYRPNGNFIFHLHSIEPIE